jgi:YVTN family beta-propeller protein
MTVTPFRDFPAILPVTLAILGTWLATAQAARAARVYVSNEDDGTVTVVDTQQPAAIETIPVGKRPRGLALSRDGTRLYVAVSGLPKCPPPMTAADCAKLPRDRQADGIAVIDTTTSQLRRVLRGVSDPERVDLSRDGHALFVSNEDAARLTVLDVASGKVLGTAAVGREPEGVRVSPNGRWVLVTSEADNSVTIVDARTRAVLRTVKVGKRPRDVAITPDSRAAYVSGEADASVYRFPLSGSAPATLLVQLRKDARPMGLALDASRKRLYVSTGDGGSVAVIEVPEGTIASEIPVEARPWGIALTDGGQHLVSANGPSGEVAVVDTQTLNVIGKVSTGRGPWGVAAAP